MSHFFYLQVLIYLFIYSKTFKLPIETNHLFLSNTFPNTSLALQSSIIIDSISE